MIDLPRFDAREGGLFRFVLEADHPAFQGHFPDFPVLPGVVQVDWALRLGEATFGPLGAFREVRHLKFQGLLQPGMAVELVLTWDEARATLTFAYHAEGERRACGTLHFTPPSRA